METDVVRPKVLYCKEMYECLSSASVEMNSIVPKLIEANHHIAGILLTDGYSAFLFSSTSTQSSIDGHCGIDHRPDALGFTAPISTRASVRGLKK